MVANTAIEQTNEYQVHPLNLQMGITTIGSDPDNDIVIQGAHVLPFHMMVDTRQKPYQVVALSPEADIRVNGVLVTSETGLEISNLEQVQFGGYALRIHETDDDGQIESIALVPAENIAPLPPPRPGVAGPAAALAPTAPGYLPSTGDDRFIVGHEDKIIMVQLEPNTLTIDVEQTANYQLTIKNGGPRVATFTVEIKGVDPDWVEISPTSVDLFERGEGIVAIRITPPRQSSSRAGSYPLQITVSSNTYRENRGYIAAELVINPYYQFSIGAPDPKIRKVSWRKRCDDVKLKLENLGNSQANFLLMAQDDENGCQFEFPVEGQNLVKQAEIEVQAGQPENIVLEITPLRRPLISLRGREYRYTVSAQALQLGSGARTVPGTFVIRALFGLWSILLFIAALLVGAYLILQPRIYNFELAKKVIRQGETAQLSWSVSPFTGDLRIDGVSEPISGRNSSIEVLPDETVESYIFYASNWLFRLLRQGEINSQQETVVVIPPSPEIETFFVDKTAVFEGDEITVKWTVNDAAAATLTIEGVRNSLSEEELSGELVVSPKKDTMVVLEAENSSGKSTRSAFVSVQKPSIEIEEFTLSATEIIVGQPVTITWQVAGVGVETVDVDPIDEELPLEGEVAIFPTESMKVILKVQNRDLKETRLLAVGVLPPGTPPEPPVINYFKASPEERVGAGAVEFSWGVSGITNNIEITNIDGVVESGLAAQGFKLINVGKTTSYVLTAYNGEVSTSANIEVKIDPAKKDVEVKILSVVPDTVLRGDAVVVYISVLPLVDGVGVNPIEAGLPEVSGDIVVTDGFDTCTITLPTTSCELTLNRSGEKILTATYGGDDNYVRRTSDPYELPITVVGLQVLFYDMQWEPSNTVVVGELVSLTFKLKPSDPNSVTPVTGKVKMFDDLEEICLTTLYPVDPGGSIPDAQGVCDNISFGKAGNLSPDLAYEGNDIYDAKDVKAPEIIVSQADTNTTIVSALPIVSIAGQPVTVNFQVAAQDPGDGIPSGSVVVKQTGGVDGVNECTGVLDEDGLGACSLPVARLNMGDEELVATYSGDARFKVSVSPPFPHTVNGAPTSIAITEFIPNTLTVGDSVTVKFAVTVDPPGTGTPTGSVIVSLPDLTTCTDPSINIDGTGQCDLTVAQSGSIPFKADYSGDSQFQSSTTTLTKFVSKADVTVSIVSSMPNPSAVNNAVTINVNANLVPASAEKPVGTINVAASTGESCSLTYPTQTSCQIVFSTYGTRDLQAEFVANANYNGDTSLLHAHTVLAQSFTSITSITPTTREVGQPVTVAYSVSGLAGTPTGTVVVTTTTTENCSSPLTAGSGSCALTFLTPGARNVRANYGGNSTYVPSISTLTPINVEKATTVVVISDYQASSTFGASAFFTATLTTPNYPGANLNGLTVTIHELTESTATCNATLNSSGVGSCAISFEKAGAKSVRADYAGSAIFKSDISPVVAHTVAKSPTTTTILSDTPDSSRVGQPVTISVRVDGSGTEDPVSGTVNISASPSGKTCVATLSGANTASCQITFTIAQTDTISAAYAGNTDFLASPTDTETHNTIPADTAVSINLPAVSSSVVGQSFNIPFSVAAVAPGSGAPSSGTVTIQAKKGLTTINCSPASPTIAAAACSMTLNETGNWTIEATYNGEDPNFNASLPATKSHTVTKANTIVSITAITPAVSVGPSKVGEPITVTFSVASSGSVVPTGTVTVEATNGTTANCTPHPTPLTAGSGSCSLLVFKSGTWVISATYNGDANFNASPTVTANHTVNAALTTTTIGTVTQTNNDKTINVPVTVAAVSPGGGDPPGTVQVTAKYTTTVIQSCNINLSSGAGTCSLTYPGGAKWPAGNVQINASYPDTPALPTPPNYLASSNSTSFVTTFIFTPSSGVAYAGLPPTRKVTFLISLALALAFTAYRLPTLAKSRYRRLPRSKDRRHPG